ncbi:MAG: magnesium transporter [Deltaproteobacteria bacterium]|nr:magnesium transporter [Deltaproteobacteria bacterium]
MAGNRSTLLFDATQRLLRRGAFPHLKRIIAKTHPADLAHLLGRFDEDQQVQLFGLLTDLEARAQVLAELGDEDAGTILQRIPRAQAVEILREMDNDDVADLLGALPEAVSQELLAQMTGEDSFEVEGLLRYSEDTAGGIMTPEFVGLPETATVGQAIELVRHKRDVEMAFYVYVVNSLGQLVGVLSLRKLVVSDDGTLLKDVMEPGVVSVRTDTDQEEVARIVARYNLLAIPVVDDRNTLLGIVTVDDVIDVLKDEATEDILKMAGAGQELVDSASVGSSIRTRWPWLMVAFFAEILGVVVVAPFGAPLEAHYYMAFFIPIIIAMGGNVGTQSATIIVRSLATGHLIPREVREAYWRELRVALLLGVIYGALAGGAGWILSGWSPGFGITVAVSMVAAMIIAVTVGALLPLFFARIRIDPAVATGPFVTSAVDVLGLLSYFLIASVILSARS